MQLKNMFFNFIEIVKIRLNKIFFKDEIIILRRVIFVGIINTIIGPSILFIFNYLLSDLVKSFFVMQFFMLFFKGILYKKIVFKEIKSRKSWTLPFIMVLWGLFLAKIIQNMIISQLLKVIILIVLLTSSNLLIALFGHRLIKKNLSTIK